MTARAAQSPDAEPIRAHRPRLADALEPLVTIEDWCDLLRCGRRTIERMRSAGRLPRPDLHVGRLPRWRADTAREWLESR
jgi:excisionase family DNA binding protein